MNNDAVFSRRLSCRTIIVLALLSLPSATSARSIFEGLELVESEGGEGVEIVSLAHSSPAARATLQVGDRIVGVERYRIRNLDDYVKASRKISNKNENVSLVYYRDGVRQQARLSIYSSALRKKWGVDVVPLREAKSSGKENADHWLDEAEKRIRKIEKTPEAQRRPEDYREVILALFTALESRPGSLSTAALIGRQYGELAALYYRRGEKKKAVWCLRRALLIYGNSLQKAEGIADLVFIRKGLGELKGTLSALR